MGQNDYTRSFAVSFWGSHVVAIYHLKTKPELSLQWVCESPTLTVLPRSLLFYSFGTTEGNGYAPHLLVGLADGTVVSFKFADKSLQDKKVFSLGELPVFMKACMADDKPTVFACGSRASILSWEKETLQHSAVNLKVRVLHSTIANMNLMKHRTSLLFLGSIINNSHHVSY